MSADDDKISNDADAMTLQEAVNAANDGDTIELEKDIKLSATLNIPGDKNITITSKNDSTYTIVADEDANLDTLIKMNEGAQTTFENINIRGLGASTAVIDSEGKLTLSKDSRIYRSEITANNKGAVYIHGSKASFTLNGGVLDKNTITADNSATVRVADGAKIEIKSGEIKNNAFPETGGGYDAGYGTGGIYLESGASGTMSGGTISGNTARRGAAIKLAGDSSERTTFTLNGGTITANTNTNGTGVNAANATAAGAVYITNNSDFIMNDGEITDNVGGMGGAVTVVDWKLQNNQDENLTSFTMNGGTISGNSARSGGGIYSYSNGTVLNAGTISGNTASILGGGVYVEGNTTYYSTTQFNNTYVAGNSAEIGGGLWLCPTGDASVHVKNGGVINSNTAELAGDDVVSAAKFDEKWSVSLENRVLGGGKVEWHEDGAVYGSTTSSPYPKSDGDNRYDNGSDPIEVKNYTDYLALKSVFTSGSLDNAKTQAKLFITDNTAVNGGGIASNGGVEIGEADPITVTAQKVWKLDNGKEATKSVIIQLQRDGEAYGEPVELSESNNWEHSWENLEGGYEWTIKEVNVPEGFEVSYSSTSKQGSLTLIATNDDKPNTPDNPDNPDNPDTPDNPENPDIPDNPENPSNPDTPNKTTTTTTTTTTSSPQTADSVALYAFGILLAACAAGAIARFAWKRH